MCMNSAQRLMTDSLYILCISLSLYIRLEHQCQRLQIRTILSIINQQVVMLTFLFNGTGELLCASEARTGK